MIKFVTKPNAAHSAQVLLLSKSQTQKLDIGSHANDIKDQIKNVIKANLFSGDANQFFPIVTSKKIVLLAGVGSTNDLSSTTLRTTIKRAVEHSVFKQSKEIQISLHEISDENIKSAIEAVAIGTYVWRKHKTPAKDDKTIVQKNYHLVATPKKIYNDFLTVCEGVNLTRDLINDNADTVTTTLFEKVVRQLIKGQKNISLEILNRKEMEKKGLGLHLAVNQGSNKEPKLIIVKYSGGGKSAPYTALIGKGVTFDTGGINLKPSGSIETMRYDMSGAGAIVGTLKNVLALKPNKNILFVMALAENAIGPDAFKPGDVLKSYDGKTVEIGNTDAEGRLVLADAFAYVIRNYKPHRIVDIATLTGACVVALGPHYAGLMSNNDDFAKSMVHASKETDDRIWRLPIYPELKEAVQSKIADIRNLGYPKGAAGTITAAEFLRQFTKDTQWAHLDIAGTAFVEGDSKFYYNHGATGMGVRLLTYYVQHN